MPDQNLAANQPQTPPVGTPTDDIAAPAPPIEPPGSAAPPMDIPPIVTPPTKKGGNGKIIATILGILVLVGGLTAGTILVRQQQIFQEKAAEACRVCRAGTCASTHASPCDNSLNGCSSDADCKVQPTTSTCKESCSGCRGECGGKPGTQYCQNRGGTCGDNGYSGCTTSACPTTAPPTACTSADCSGCAQKGGTCTGTKPDCHCTGLPTAALGSNGCPSGWSCDKIYTEGTTCQATWPNSIQQACKLTDSDTAKSGTCCIPPPAATASTAPTSPSGPGITGGPTAPPSLPAGVSAQCFDIKVFDTNWTQITDFSTLKEGDTVRFTVSGNPPDQMDQARFTINGVQRPAVTAKRPSTNEFYDEYTFPAGVTSFTINAQLHNITLGWF